MVDIATVSTQGRLEIEMNHVLYDSIASMSDSETLFACSVSIIAGCDPHIQSNAFPSSTITVLDKK